VIEIKHNTWPLPNMKEVSAKDFWLWISIWGGPKTTYIQSQQEGERNWFNPVVFVIDHSDLAGGGFVVKNFYSGPRAGEQAFFRWRECDHEFEHKSGGNCYHIYTCKKCGARHDVDSSD